MKPAQCCIKFVFHLTYTMMHGNTKLKFVYTVFCIARTVFLALFRLCIFIRICFVCTSLRTIGTGLQLNCS